jgi:hypothetical protein
MEEETKLTEEWRDIAGFDGRYQINKRLGYSFDKCFDTIEEAIAAKRGFLNGKKYYAI